MEWILSRRACLLSAASVLPKYVLATSGPALVVGQSAPTSGYAAEATSELNAGIVMCFEQINRGGGIAGRSLVLRTLDDGYDPRRTVANTLALLTDPAVLALTAYRGTPNIEAAFSSIEQGGVALIGPQSGASSMYDKSRPFIFPSRASYRAEVENIVKHATTIGMQRVALFYTDSAFGIDVRNAARTALARHRLDASTEANFPRHADNVAPAVAAIAAARPQMVLIATAAGPAASFIKAARQQMPGCEFYALSNVSQASFAEAVAAAGKPAVVAQVFPHVNSNNQLLKEFREEAVRAKVTKISYAVIEGYVTGKLVATALRLAGPRPTRASVARALVGQRIDLGGMIFEYPEGSYIGSRFVELSLITSEGKFIR